MQPRDDIRTSDIDVMKLSPVTIGLLLAKAEKTEAWHQNITNLIFFPEIELKPEDRPDAAIMAGAHKFKEYPEIDGGIAGMADVKTPVIFNAGGSTTPEMLRGEKLQTEAGIMVERLRELQPETVAWQLIQGPDWFDDQKKLIADFSDETPPAEAVKPDDADEAFTAIQAELVAAIAERQNPELLAAKGPVIAAERQSRSTPMNVVYSNALSGGYLAKASHIHAATSFEHRRRFMMTIRQKLMEAGMPVEQARALRITTHSYKTPNTPNWEQSYNAANDLAADHGSVLSEVARIVIYGAKDKPDLTWLSAEERQMVLGLVQGAFDGARADVQNARNKISNYLNTPEWDLVRNEAVAFLTIVKAEADGVVRATSPEKGKQPGKENLEAIEYAKNVDVALLAAQPHGDWNKEVVEPILHQILQKKENDFGNVTQLLDRTRARVAELEAMNAPVVEVPSGHMLPDPTAVGVQQHQPAGPSSTAHVLEARTANDEVARKEDKGPLAVVVFGLVAAVIGLAWLAPTSSKPVGAVVFGANAEKVSTPRAEKVLKAAPAVTPAFVEPAAVEPASAPVVVQRQGETAIEHVADVCSTLKLAYNGRGALRVGVHNQWSTARIMDGPALYDLSAVAPNGDPVVQAVLDEAMRLRNEHNRRGAEASRDARLRSYQVLARDAKFEICSPTNG